MIGDPECDDKCYFRPSVRMDKKVVNRETLIPDCDLDYLEEVKWYNGHLVGMRSLRSLLCTKMGSLMKVRVPSERVYFVQPRWWFGCVQHDIGL